MRRATPRTCLLAALLAVATLAIPQQAISAPILFDFESPPDSDQGNGINPIFTSNGFSIRHANVSRAGASQWTNDERVVPRSGTGGMRLIYGAIPNVLVDTAIDFSEEVGRLEISVSVTTDSLVTVQPLVVSAYAVNGDKLGEAVLPAVGTYSSPVWSRVTFSGIGPIKSLLLVGIAPHVYWDDLRVTIIPEPTGILVVGTAILFASIMFSRSFPDTNLT